MAPISSWLWVDFVNNDLEYARLCAYPSIGEHLLVTRYYLRDSVYFCYAGSQVVFLDLEANRFRAIDRRQATTLNGVVAGWKAPEHATKCLEDAMSTKRIGKQLTEDLVKYGMLTESREAGKKATPTSADRPTADLLVEYELKTPTIRLRDVVRVVKAYLHGAVSFRVSSMAQIAERVKAHRGQGRRLTDSGSVDELRALVLVYFYVRPFFFSTSERCYLDSLVLVEFLRHYGFHPTWVIGVSTDPFLAHAWLEVDGVVINDRAMRANHYVPIFVL